MSIAQTINAPALSTLHSPQPAPKPPAFLAAKKLSWVPAERSACLAPSSSRQWVQHSLSRPTCMHLAAVVQMGAELKPAVQFPSVVMGMSGLNQSMLLSGSPTFSTGSPGALPATMLAQHSHSAVCYRRHPCQHATACPSRRTMHGPWQGLSETAVTQRCHMRPT